MPPVFQSLEEAREFLNQAAEGIFAMIYLWDGTLPIILQSPVSFELNENATKQLFLWDAAFQAFMRNHSESFTSRQLRGAAILKIHHTVGLIMAGIRPPLEDMRSMAQAVNDKSRLTRFINEFRLITNMARSLILAAEQDTQNGRQALTFSTDLGVIGPLYFTCSKCPDNALRNEALSLLKRCPRREGMWNSEPISKIICEFWDISENHEKLLDSGEALVDDYGFPVSLNDALDLVLKEGMKWEWKFKTESMERIVTSISPWTPPSIAD
jgi:hypothetical protein